MKKFLTCLVVTLMALAVLLNTVGCVSDGGADITDTEGNTTSDTETDTETVKETDKETDKDDQVNDEVSDEKTIKILAIGNSFSIDAMEHLWGILRDGGYETVVLGNLYIGGCTLNTHWSNISSNSAAYTYYENTTGTWQSVGGFKLSTALKRNKWDVITVQQASGGSGVASTYSNLDNILNYVNAHKTNPNARILWHMTWAYEGDSTHSDFAKYNKDQMTMYNAIVSTVKSSVDNKSLISGVIPSGTAIQNLRTSYIGDNVTRDGYHLNLGFGRYTAGLTWYAYITGRSVDDIDWVPSSYSGISADLAVIKESVKNAIAKPDAVTNSKYASMTDATKFAASGLNIENYELLDLNMTVGTFYNSTKSHALRTTADGESTSLLSKYSASSKFTKAELPVGTVIIVDTGYQYRPDAWANANTLTTARPANVTSSFVTVTDNWWGSFTICGFNLSRIDGAAMTAADNAHLRIYVPKAGN